MNKVINLSQGKRLLSLDFFRGFTMLVLIGEATWLFPVLISPEFEGTFIYSIGTQLHHHPWHGLIVGKNLLFIYLFTNFGGGIFYIKL